MNAGSRLLILSGCMGVCAFFVYFPITDADIFWHLAAGREMVKSNSFLFTDPFSYSIPKNPWVNLHWLFQLVVYALYSIGSYKALIALKLVAAASTAGLLCSVNRSTISVSTSAFVAAVLVYTTRYLICVRPVILSIFCMALYILFFEKARNSSRLRKILWLCLPVQIIWANSQGLYIIGLFIIAAYWAESILTKDKDTCLYRKRIRFYTIIFAASTFSCLLNPYGIRGLLLPFRLFARITPLPQNVFSLNIPENVPLFSLAGYDGVYCPVVIFSAALMIAGFYLNRKALRPAHLMLFAGFFMLALSAERNILLYCIAVIPLAGYNAGIFFAGLRSVFIRKLLGGVFVITAVSVMAALVACRATDISKYPAGCDISPFRFPEKATEYLLKNPVPGNMFNDIRYGGYLIWKVYPDDKVFIDTRLVLRSAGFFSDYLSVCEHPEFFVNIEKKFGITHVILPWAVFPLYHKLILWLYYSPEWKLVFTDGTSVLFVKKSCTAQNGIDLSDSIQVTAIADSIHQQWKNDLGIRNEATETFLDMLDNTGLSRSRGFIKKGLDPGHDKK
jgi:hypothetical protein